MAFLPQLAEIRYLKTVAAAAPGESTLSPAVVPTISGT